MTGVPTTYLDGGDRTPRVRARETDALGVAFLQMLDLATFLPAVRRVPWGESSPVPALVMESGGEGGVILLKVVAVLLILALLPRLTGRKRTTVALVGIIIGALGVATNLIGGGFA
jgi:uncharacterized membrane protein